MSEIIEETNKSVESFSVNGADSVVIVYSNTAKPGFEIIYFNAQKKEIGFKKIKLDADQIVDGLPIPTLNLESMLKQYIPSQVKSVDILLDSDNIFKVTNVYPKINFFKLAQVYSQDMKEAHGDIKDKFKSFSQQYKNYIGIIIYTYFIPEHLYNFGIKLARSLNIKLGKIDLYAKFIMQNVHKTYGGDFIYLYGHEDQITLVVSYGGMLSGFVTFDGTNKDKVDEMIHCYGIKHFYELEKTSIRTAFTNIDELSSKVIAIEKKELQLDETVIGGLKK